MWCCTLSRRCAWTSVRRPPAPPPSPWNAPAVLDSAGRSCRQLPTRTGEPPYPRYLCRPATQPGLTCGRHSGRRRGVGCPSSAGRSRRSSRSPSRWLRLCRGRPPSSFRTLILPPPPSPPRPRWPPCHRRSLSTVDTPFGRLPARRI